LSRPFTIVVLIAITLIAVATFRAYAATRVPWKDAGYCMVIKKARTYKNSDMTDDKFKELLQTNNAVYCIKVKKDDSSDPTDLTGNDCSGAASLMSTTSVDNATRELVLTCGGARVTQRVGFSTAKQLMNVDNALSTPTPAP
jgi:hypothetical protein